MAKARGVAVIGAGWGDEGKGHVVDALAATASETPVVVRFNGGAQAGHTVVLDDGRRHVFHHLGAGALAGARTHLSRHFVHHPMLLQAEREAVRVLVGSPALSADPRGAVTTPWDMLINQVAERMRGGARHGSCGLGFGETIERDTDGRHVLRVGDLGAADLGARLKAIREVWAPARLAGLGVASLTPEETALLEDDAIEAVFVEDCRAFADTVKVAPDAGLGAAGPVIFEGAQGLQLDQAIGAFPHVTRSHTGLVNVLAIAREADLEAIDAIYVTRAYATRHGAGPLPGGREDLEAFDIVDPTNAPNPWQGRMRYAALDISRLAGALAEDGRLGRSGAVQVNVSLFVTCLDQIRRRAPVSDTTGVSHFAPDQLAGALCARLDMTPAGESWGPERSRIHLTDAVRATVV